MTFPVTIVLCFQEGSVIYSEKLIQIYRGFPTFLDNFKIVFKKNHILCPNIKGRTILENKETEKHFKNLLFINIGEVSLNQNNNNKHEDFQIQRRQNGGK